MPVTFGEVSKPPRGKSAGLEHARHCLIKTPRLALIILFLRDLIVI